MRFIVVGAGSVGGTIGGALAEAGRDVVLVARGAHLEALQSTGLTLMTPSRTLKPAVLSVAGPDELELTGDDVLIFAVKGQEAGPLLAQWSAQPVRGGGFAGERLPLVCAQNGVANEFAALRYFERVYGMCIWLPAALAEPGVVVAYAVPVFGVLDLGRVGGAVADSGRGDGGTADVLAAEFTRAGFAAYATDDVMSWKYGKLLRNLGNAVQAACGSEPSAGAEELDRLVVAEAEEVYRRAGIEAVDLEQAYVARGDEFGVAEVADRPRAGGSTWQSLNRRSPTVEVDYLNGEIVALGRVHGVHCPANECLRRIVNAMAASQMPPGSVTADEILAQIQR